LELACLRALWKLQEANVQAVRDALADRELAYTTVLTLLDRLVRRGIADRRKQGRGFVYRARSTQEALRRVALDELVRDYFDGSWEDFRDYVRGGKLARPSESIDASLL
jgi:predicted transcriptional regulator